MNTMDIQLQFPLTVENFELVRQLSARVEQELGFTLPVMTVFGAAGFALLRDGKPIWTGERLEEPALLRALSEATGATATVASEQRRSDNAFSVRPFGAALEAFERACPDDREVHEQSQAGSTAAYASEDLEQWPESPPVPSLYLQTTEASRLFRVEEAVSTPYAAVNRCRFNAVGTWNCNVKGVSVGGNGWRIVVATLTNEQREEAAGRDVHAIFAVWHVEGGEACAVMRVHQRESVAQMLGLAEWPTEGWQPFVAWYGE